MSDKAQQHATAGFTKDSPNDLIQFLQQTPERLSQLIDGLSDSDLRNRNSDSEFSALENICHLRDLEIQGYTPRIERMLAESVPVLADFDGARVAAESSYNDEQPDVVLNVFALARQANARKLSGLNATQFEREGSLEGVGQITLRRLTEMMREHDEGHLEDLRVLRQQLQRRAEAEA